MAQSESGVKLIHNPLQCLLAPATRLIKISGDPLFFLSLAIASSPREFSQLHFARRAMFIATIIT